MSRYKTGGYKDVVGVSLPLVLSMGSTTVMEFTDRVFLGNYSLNALAAAMPAGITSFVFTSFFMGVASYTSVFVAQNIGAGNQEGVGSSLWQGIYFTLIGSVIMALLSFTAEPVFRFIGHHPDIQRLEVIYFRILCIGTGAGLLGSTLSCFFSGRGVTQPILVIHTLGTLFNIPLDYALINGAWGFPEWGIMGAAVATVCSWVLVALLFVLIVFTQSNNRNYSVLRKRQFNKKIFASLMKFGIPGGIQFFVEIMAFTFFILIVGRIGKEALAVSNMILSINALAYMPMFGFSSGLSTLVGQAIGKKSITMAVTATRATTHIVIGYISLLTLLFIFFPAPFIHLFLPDNIPLAESQEIMATGIILLRFVIIYLFFDSLAIIYTGALKGAGDTRFIMLVFSSTSFFFLFIPVYTGVTYLEKGLYYSWGCLTFYIIVLYCFIFTRYLTGKWKDMQVIDR